MNKVNIERLKSIRAFWLGSLVISFLIQQHKLSAPILYRADAAEMPIYKLRNLDARESLESSRQITVVKHGKIKRILLDSRSRSGTNSAFASACGVALISLGSPLIYGFSARWNKGGVHTNNYLKIQFGQILIQLGCTFVRSFSIFFIEN